MALDTFVRLANQSRLRLYRPSYCQQLVLDVDSIKRAINTACGFAALMERMRQDAEHEMQAAAEWMKWLKYGEFHSATRTFTCLEIARAASQDQSSDTLSIAMHDLKLAWSFMQNGFVASPFQRHFPSLATASEDILPTSIDVYPTHTTRELAAVMSETMRRLSSPSESALPSSQRTADYASPGQAEHSVNSSFAISSPSETTHTRAKSADASQSPDTVDVKKDIVKMPMRQLDEQPLVWANTLLAQCEALVERAVSGPTASGETPSDPLPRRDPGGDSLYAERVTPQVRRLPIFLKLPSNPRFQGRWIAYVPATGPSDNQCQY